MLCLGLDTTGQYCSAALVDGETVLARASQKIGTGHAEILGPMVQTLLIQAKTSVKQIDKIAVCVGPGSFTGLRVGLSFAKGLALPHNIPLVGISALEVWAKARDPEGALSIISAADVKRGQILYQNWVSGISENAPALLEYQAAETVFKPMVKTGGWISGSTYVCPEILAWLGMEKNSRDHPAEPLYHRPPDAKLPGGKSL